ncbi:MAG: hypothetical protein JHC33_10900 [Ignisphaera sp.]|nr:hypothetical protein [Ignisphaera sp.]
MSNSATKKARRRSNLFENDYDELIYSSDPIKIKNIEVEKVRKSKIKQSTHNNTNKPSFGEAISSVPVKCTCNTCGNPIEGTLIGIMFCPISGLNTPFISYECTFCKKSGRRSVKTKALPSEQFDRIYF